MIISGSAQMMNGSGGAAPVTSTLASADFLSGVYTVGGVAVTAADIVDQPSLIGAGGLFIDDSVATGIIELIGGLRDALLTLNWTVVIEYESLDALHKTMLLAMSNAGGTNLLHIERRTNANGLAILVQDTSPTGWRENLDATGYGAGIHKIAVTRTSTLLATSVNGNAAEVESAALTLSVDSAAFGEYAGKSYPYNSCYIRRLDVLEPASAASLPALSA